MPNDIYPSGSVRTLLQTDFVSPQTKAVLNERLQASNRIAPTFFDEETFRILEAVCDCFFPQEDKSEKVPLAIMLEKEFATGKGRGWRYLELPPIKDAVKQGLKTINAEAQERYQTTFVQLSATDKEAVLTAVQKAEVTATAWSDLPSDLFFTELLTTATEQYYSHPLAKEEIGDVSFADEGGWHAIGLNNLEDREPRTTESSAHAKH